MVEKSDKAGKKPGPKLVDAEFTKELLEQKQDAARRGSVDGGAANKSDEMSAQELKAERLAQALRENLRKRKEQSRGRHDQEDD
jgi:hypothetical protein